MTITTAEKATVIEEYRTHDTDTGSPEVQVAVITRRILNLSEHFKKHSKDHHSRRGLLALVSQRKRLLGYLQKNEVVRYRVLIKRLGIRGYPSTLVISPQGQVLDLMEGFLDARKFAKRVSPLLAKQAPRVGDASAALVELETVDR